MTCMTTLQVLVLQRSHFLMFYCRSNNLLVLIVCWRYIGVCWCVCLCLLSVRLIQLVLHELLSEELLTWTGLNHDRVVLRNMFGCWDSRVALASESWIVDWQRVKVKSLMGTLIVWQDDIFWNGANNLLLLLVIVNLISIRGIGDILLLAWLKRLNFDRLQILTFLLLLGVCFQLLTRRGSLNISWLGVHF
jgi:hypothetical protein